ncbi:single-stranded DNA-binding protein [Amycolatopsis nigrescens]|uniref:single-stranded DNA-binding protein n=1 Tax=Amycolatopsis nigrescens TaxID=381445 RepID=UPI00037EA17B|nr:single-stranded DNA-binding protein [Amycolatopsis nigrescens]
MAVWETTLTLVGNVVSDLTGKTLNDGAELTTFWMRSNERKRDRATGEWVDGRRFSVRVTCWRELALSVRQSLAKGDPVVVLGRLSSSDYETGGQLRSIPELEAFALGPNLGRCTATVRRSRKAEPAAGAAQWGGPDGAATDPADTGKVLVGNAGTVPAD